MFYEGTQNDENRKFYSLFLREINDKFIDCLKKDLKDINNIREFLKMLREKKNILIYLMNIFKKYGINLMISK